MKVQIDDISPVKKRMEIEVPLEDVEREMNDIVRQTARTVKIPGFRRGHVPASLVRKRFAKELEQQAAEKLVAEFTERAVKERNLQPLHDPVVEDVVFRQGEPLRFKALLEIRPEIHLGQYRGLATVQPPGEASEEDISGALEKLRESAARYLPVEPRRVVDGDHVIANVAGRFPDGDGEEFRHESVMIAVGAKENLTEFNEVLPGASPGEEKTFEVRYPADFGGKQLAGKRVEYALELRDIKRRELPALDDEFAHDLGVKEGLAALRAKVKSDLVEARRRQAAAEARESALRQLIEAHPFEVPDSLVERQLGRQMEEIVRSMLASGMKPPEVERLWGEMRERELPKARQRVRGMLLLDEIARQESLAVSDEEVVARIERDAKEMGVRPEVVRAQLEKQDSTQALKNQMLREKALDILLNGSRISA